MKSIIFVYFHLELKVKLHRPLFSFIFTKVSSSTYTIVYLYFNADKKIKIILVLHFEVEKILLFFFKSFNFLSFSLFSSFSQKIYSEVKRGYESSIESNTSSLIIVSARKNILKCCD